jgi:hypothetical protein
MVGNNHRKLLTRIELWLLESQHLTDAQGDMANLPTNNAIHKVGLVEHVDG